MLTQAEFLKNYDYNPILGTIVETGTFKNVGYINSKGYRVCTIYGKKYYAHRLAFLVMDGIMPTLQVDHINGIKNDNSWDNLRLVNNQENHRNRPKNKNNKSGFTGVRYNPKQGAWVARIHVDYHDIHLGYFNTKNEAIAAREAANIMYGFHQNHGKDLT